ncbi:MAG: CapA family protein [Desulfocucumaceae bacterium]
MNKFLFLRLLAILTCFVLGGIMAGGAVASAKINRNQLAEAYVLGIAEDHFHEGGVSDRAVVSVVGDVLLASGVGSAIASLGANYPWQDVSRVLSYADITIANLECSVSDRGVPVPDKQYTFRASPGTLEGAANAGVDVFTLANNHVLDYGQEAFIDTMNNLRKNNIDFAGGGTNEDSAYSPVIIEKKNKKFAVFSFSKVIPSTDWIAAGGKPGIASGFNERLMFKKIREFDGKVDETIVCLHWGEETDEFPNKEEINLAHRLVDAGADVVIGHHSHVLQGVEVYKGKLIAYSLGNFIFTSSSQRARQGAILQISYDSEGSYSARIIPTYITGGSAAILRGSDREGVLGRLNGLSQELGTAVSAEGIIKGIRDGGGIK